MGACLTKGENGRETEGQKGEEAMAWQAAEEKQLGRLCFPSPHPCIRPMAHPRQLQLLTSAQSARYVQLTNCRNHFPSLWGTSSQKVLKGSRTPTIPRPSCLASAPTIHGPPPALSGAPTGRADSRTGAEAPSSPAALSPTPAGHPGLHLVSRSRPPPAFPGLISLSAAMSVDSRPPDSSPRRDGDGAGMSGVVVSDSCVMSKVARGTSGRGGVSCACS